MNINDLWPYVAVFPFISSVVFFVLAKEMDLARRSFASIHGWAALLILPFAVYVSSQHPGLRESIGVLGFLIIGGVAAVSIFYAVAMVRARWVYHLLHIPTVFVIGISSIYSLFVLAEAH